MRDIILDYGFIIPWVIGVVEIILTFILFSDHSKKKDPIIICMALLGVGLCFDVAVIGAGRIILIPFLRVLSQGRYILHGMLIPLNLMICAYAAPFNRRWRSVMWVLTALLMLAGTASGVFREYDIKYIHEGEFNEIVRFISVSPRNSWMEYVNMALSFGAIIPVILTGIWVTIRQKTPMILFGGLLMLGFTAVGPATGNADLLFLISMFGEMFLLLFYTLYEKRHISKMYDYYN